MIRRLSGFILLGISLLLASAVAAQQTTSTPNPTPTPRTYTVVSGDTLGIIAARYHTTVVEIMRANHITNPNLVYVGTVLILPGEGEVATSTGTGGGTKRTPTPAPTPTPVPEYIAAGADSPIGFEVGGEVFNPGQLRSLRQANMAWAKIDLVWHVGDTADAIPTLLRQVQQRGKLKLLLAISGDGQQFRANPDTYTQQFTEFLGQVAALSPDAIEVWEGMNADGISADAYAKLMNASFLSIKRANLQVLVISGALQKANSLGGQCTSNGCGDIPYLNALADAGLAESADCIGMRYTLGAVSPDDSSGDPRGDEFDYYFPTTISTYATIFPTKPLCFTALGYLVTGLVPLENRYDWAQNTTPALRATWIARAAVLASKTNRIRLMIVYNMDASINTEDVPQTSYAIVSSTGDCPPCRAIASAYPPPRPTPEPTIEVTPEATDVVIPVTLEATPTALG